MAERRPDADEERPVGFRAALSRGEDTVDVATWAGAIPAATGVAPRVRVGSRWFNLLWLLPLGFLLLLIGVAAAKGLRGMPSVQDFIARHPGTDLRADRRDYLGIPAWARWQHFLNVFFMLFILRSGLQILTDHPRLYWTRHSMPGRHWFRIQSRCRLIRSGRPSRTRSACPVRSACRVSGTPSAWPAGGTSG